MLKVSRAAIVGAVGLAELFIGLWIWVGLGVAMSVVGALLLAAGWWADQPTGGDE